MLKEWKLTEVFPRVQEAVRKKYPEPEGDREYPNRMGCISGRRRSAQHVFVIHGDPPLVIHQGVDKLAAVRWRYIRLYILSEAGGWVLRRTAGVGFEGIPAICGNPGYWPSCLGGRSVQGVGRLSMGV